MRRLFVLLFSGVILASSISMDAAASSEKAITVDMVAPDAPVSIIKGEPTGSTSQPSQIALEAAIKMVKSKITVPAEFSEFNYYFNDASTYSDANWTMTWSTKDGNASITISSDEDYHITNFSQYDYSKTETGISKYLKKELLQTAESFILQVAPETSGKLKYVESNFESVYSGNYVYSFQRQENGIAFPDNTVQVHVNSITGKVNAINVNWLYDAKLPSVTTKLTKEEATKLIKENMKMRLVYHSNYYSIYDTRGNSDKKAFLVYEPTQAYISIDAKTGEVYLTKSEWINTRAELEKATDAAEANGSTTSTTNQLTEEELKRVQELKNIISKDKAIETITGNSALYLDKNLNSISATLNKIDDSKGTSSYVWNINLSDPREIDYEKEKSYYRGYAYASVDAVTGKILSFYSSVKSYYDEVNKKWNTVKIPFDQKESQEILEKFLKKQANDRFTNSVLVETNDDYVVFYKNEIPVYGGYNYHYNRVNQGFEYPHNSIYGSVDGVTGKIYSFGSNWEEDIVFESPKGAMTSDQAMDAYLSKDGYELVYEINQITKYDDSKKNLESNAYNNLTSVEYEVRLVYRPTINPSYISPFSGEQLDYQGEIYKDIKPFTYLDIKDETKYRNILLLADMNIGFEGDNFLPDQAINVGEINDLLNKIGNSYYYTEVSTTTVEDARLITREEIAQTFITKLGLEKLAKLSGIYKTGFADENLIDEKYLGAVALAKGYGLMKSDIDNKFNPKSNMTRFDAVDMILNFIQVQKNGVY
ncbi:MAG: hypothetical protein K0R46_3431 [Herbinix sp.]|jgi:hypothetical protein|nr:hypothetical protein [Herbinix sp.]